MIFSLEKYEQLVSDNLLCLIQQIQCQKPKRHTSIMILNRLSWSYINKTIVCTLLRVLSHHRRRSPETKELPRRRETTHVYESTWSTIVWLNATVYHDLFLFVKRKSKKLFVIVNSTNCIPSQTGIRLGFCDTGAFSPSLPLLDCL